MAEQARHCPHCGGNIEIELNCSICLVLFGTSKTFRSEDWVRRTPGPATKAMIDRCQAWLAGEPALDWPGVTRAFIDEWK